MLGPKCTGFLLFMSIWGAIFLAILGGLYYNKSVGLLDDLPDESSGMEIKPWNERVKNINNLFEQNAYNCWVAAGIYAGIALLTSFRACCLLRR